MLANVNHALTLKEWNIARLIILQGKRHLQINVTEKPAGPGQELMKNLFNILKFIFSHPLSSRNKWAALKRFVIWQGGSRIIAAPNKCLLIQRLQNVRNHRCPMRDADRYRSLIDMDQWVQSGHQSLLGSGQDANPFIDVIWGRCPGVRLWETSRKRLDL